MNEESIREPKLRTINFEAFVRSQEKKCLRRELKKVFLCLQRDKKIGYGELVSYAFSS